MQMIPKHVFWPVIDRLSLHAIRFRPNAIAVLFYARSLPFTS